MAKVKEQTPEEIIASLEAEKAELVEVVKDLKAKLAVATKSVEAKENIVKHDGKKYKVICASFHFNGSEHKAEELAKKPELVAELVEIGAGFLQEVQ